MHGRIGLSDCGNTPYSADMAMGDTLTASDANPCDDEKFPIIDSVWYAVIGKGYEDAITTIKNRVNFNIGPRCYVEGNGLDTLSPIVYASTRIYAAITGSKCFSENEVACIVNSYSYHASQKQYSPYNPAIASDAKNIIDWVHGDTTKPKDRVETVLNQLYYAVADGSITSWQLLDPIGYEAKKGTMDIPKDVQSGSRDTASLFGDIGTYAKYAAYAVGGGVVIYGAVQLIGLFKTIKGAA